jgi:hypothetical protein
VITIKPGKDWKKVLRLMEHYDKRLRYSQTQIIKDIAETFLGILKSKIPKMEEDREYRDSLKVMAITGTGKNTVYAVVSERDRVSLAKLRHPTSRPTVVYVEQKKGRGQMDPMVSLMVLNNPWPPAMIPANLPPKKVHMVHTVVSEEEFKWAVKNAQTYIRENQVEFAKAKARFRPETAEDTDEELSGLESMPDYMSFALRSEFGINLKNQSHWRPALRALSGRLARIIKNDQNIQGALYDELFNKHLASKEKYKDEIPKDQFEKEAGVFQKRIASVAGVK